MTPDELRYTNDFYKQNAKQWRFCQSAYTGTNALIDVEGIIRNDEDRDRRDIEFRESAAWGENLSTWIVDVLSNFVGMIPFEESFETIQDDWAFKAFKQDCDLFGTDWDVFWNDTRKAVSAVGMQGLLVDKGISAIDNIEEAKNENVYPYICCYSPLSVLDFTYERNPKSNRPFLSYLKLIEQDGTFKIWFRDKWESWTINNNQTILLNEGENPLNKIPFTWFYNTKSVFNKMLGMSDIDNIARIDSSIIQATADIAQIMRAAGYLMLLRPTSAIREESELKVGPNEIIPFDADNPSGTKPDWLVPQVSAPIVAALQIIEKQEQAAIRSKNLSIIFAAMAADARSSDSLKQTMKFLESELTRKVSNEIEARKSVIQDWLLWQGMEGISDKIIISHPKRYDIASFLTTIADAMTANLVVTGSQKFRKELQKLVVRRIDPDLSDSDKKEIFSEIDKSKNNVSIDTDIK